MNIANFKPTATLDLVGFLPINDALHFTGGRFEPVPDLAGLILNVAEFTNADHFVYPPTIHKVTTGSFEPSKATWTEVPKTSRPAHLHRLPPSHFLHIDSLPVNANLRSEDGAFLIYAAGYVFGYRMQFYDWWFDGRLPMRSAHGAHVTPNTASAFLDKAYSSWRAWPSIAKKRFTNALYMLRRGSSYEWDWEEFTIYYMVFDALYRTANELHRVTAAGHQKKIEAMCLHYGLFQDANLFSEIAKLRRELFHEALWAGGQPGVAMANDPWALVGGLRRICERLVPAIVGYKTDYVATPWNSMGKPVF